MKFKTATKIQWLKCKKREITLDLCRKANLERCFVWPIKELHYFMRYLGKFGSKVLSTECPLGGRHGKMQKCHLPLNDGWVHAIAASGT